MEVKALPTTGIIPGCKTILGYKGSQPNPTTELNSSISFNASFACESQTSMVTTPAMVEPFRIQIAEVVIPSVPNAFTEYLNSL